MILPLGIPSRSLADEHPICEHLLNSAAKPFHVQENAPALRSDQPVDRDSALLEPCEGNCLRYSQTGNPFDTSPELTETSLAHRYYYRGPFLVLEDGRMIGEPIFRQKYSHSHLQLAQKDRVYFAGHVVTSPTGQILYIDYSSQTPQRPYVLKSLINDLGGPRIMKDTVVYLSDASTELPLHAYLPRIPVPDFYSLCRGPADSGIEVLFRYLASPPADFSNLSYEDVLEPAAVQVFRVVEDETIQRKVLNKASDQERASLIEKLSRWVIKVYNSSDKSALRVASAYKIMHSSQKPGHISSEFEIEFYLTLFRTLPDLKARLMPQDGNHQFDFKLEAMAK
jgi:hypothetical protein